MVQSEANREYDVRSQYVSIPEADDPRNREILLLCLTKSIRVEQE